MNNDILPPKRPLPPLPPTMPVAPLPPPVEPPLSITPPLPAPDKPKTHTKKALLWVLVSFLVVMVTAITAAYFWYNWSLQPVDSKNESRTRIQIATGSTPTAIAQLLEDKKLIRSHLAFDIYIRLFGAHATLQAGTYSLSPSESTEEIVDHLAKGNVDQFNITFLPGATLAENRAKLIKAGYSSTEVDAAFRKTYNLPLFADKPASADLEGYIYGETYNFDGSATVEQILTKTFDEYYAALQSHHLIEGFKQHGLNLYQAVTLASIIQREVSQPADQKVVAQIFYKRLSIDMPLGSDVTYQYAAKKLGITPSPDLDSPYNTRKYTGLPPGPIAAPGLSALEAVANPAATTYLFFLSGDDNVTYYANSDAEHQANIRDHCKVKCSLL